MDIEIMLKIYLEYKCDMHVSPKYDMIGQF